MSENSKTIVLSGGGTAGHIYPALALAERLVGDGYNVKYAGTPNGLEATLVPEENIDFKPFSVTGFNRSRPWTLISGGVRALKSTNAAKKWFSEIKPSCVVGFGGYVSVPVARAAEKMNIPVVVHEQNSVMGIANKNISKHAKKVCLTYPLDEEGLDPSKCVVTGNPVRSSVLEASRAEGRVYLGIPDSATILLVFGGSRGAKHLNEAIAAMKDALLAQDNLHIVHVTGSRDFDYIAEKLNLDDEEATRWHLKAYESKMGLALAACDVTVCRAGATSLAELAALSKPALLVPYPHARGGHQELNAAFYVEVGAATMIKDDEIDTSRFSDELLNLVSNSGLRAKMEAAANSLGAKNACERLAEIVERISDSE